MSLISGHFKPSEEANKKDMAVCMGNEYDSLLNIIMGDSCLPRELSKFNVCADEIRD